MDISNLYMKSQNNPSMIYGIIFTLKSKKFPKGNISLDAAENAFKEINARTKRIYANACSNTPIPNGAAAMTRVYSSNNPIVEFCDRHTESGQNTQLGFMKMAEGAMTALRYPVAHENLNMSQDNAMRQLMFASMIMYKIDEDVIYSGITEEE